MSTNLTIFLTRAGRNTGDDDVIMVNPVGDEFKVTYTNRVEGFTHFFFGVEKDVMNYIYDLLRGARRDTDPYEYVQFNLPCFPSFIYKTAQLTDDLCDMLMRRTQQVVANWPERLVTGVLRQHVPASMTPPGGEQRYA